MKPFDLSPEEGERNKKRLGEAGFAFSAEIVLAGLLSVLIQGIASAAAGPDAAGKDWYLYLQYLVPQFALAGAAAIYFRRSGERVRTLVPVRRPQYFAVALLLQFGLLFSLSELNGLFLRGLEQLGYSPSLSPVPSLGGWNLLPALLVIALLPAVFEECLFRGILARNFYADGWGLAPTVCITGLLFALYHGRPEQTVYQFICGACYALLAIRAGSILPTMLAHFANNAVILTLGSFGYADLSALPLGGYLAVVILSATCLAASLVFLLFLDKRGNRRGTIRDGKVFFLTALVGIAVCAVTWIALLITGFLHV